MKTKVLVIPIDLGFVIDDIINTDLTLLTKDSKDQLDRAISVAKAIQAVKDQKTQAKTEKLTKEQTILETIYTNITETKNIGYPLANIKELLEPLGISLSTITVKLKQMLNERLPNHDLEKVKRGGIQYYKFISLN